MKPRETSGFYQKEQDYNVITKEYLQNLTPCKYDQEYFDCISLTMTFTYVLHVVCNYVLFLIFNP